jgi:hypothetical protein
MLQQNSRIEKFKGYRFYEKDILHDDYVFTHDIEVNVDVTYITPGFGIALIDTGSSSIKDKPDTYLFKVGYREASIYYSTAAGTTLISQVSCPDATIIQENMSFTLKKSGKKVQMYLNDKLIFEQYVNKSLDKYNIGYYSNIGNIINSINIAANIPNNWVVNMKNTKGGYVRFLQDSFEITDCTSNAEIEQTKIELKAGTYYLKNKLTAINDSCDIKCYIYRTDDDRYTDEEKNMLRNNSFTIFEDNEVTLKIVGTNGKISDITLAKDQNADYIPTSLNAIDFDGSYIDILIGDFEKITWKGIVNKTPYKDPNSNKIKYGLILDDVNAVMPQDTNILLGKEYDYEFNCRTFLFSILDNGTELFSKRIINISNKITIFKNLSAIIYKLTFYKKDSTVVDVVTSDEDNTYVNANITSPIIVVDEYNLPLDLSSSYRLCKYDDHEKYIFTNWEREYFIPSRTLKMNRQIINKQASVFVYGIRKNTEFNLTDIYNVPNDNINAIDLMTKEYDYIAEKDLLLFDKNKSIIYLTDAQIEKYELIIVDYLKNDSYSINYNYAKNIYEIEISSLNNTKVLYDTLPISELNGKLITQVNNYKMTNINGNINGYIVLSQGGI